MDETLRLPSGYVEMFSEFLDDETPTRGVDEIIDAYPSSNHWISFYLWWAYHRKLRSSFAVFEDFSSFFQFVLQYKAEVLYLFKHNSINSGFVNVVGYILKELPRKCFSVVDDILEFYQGPDDAAISGRILMFPNEIEAYFIVKNLPAYRDKNIVLLEELYRGAFKQIIQKDPSYVSMNISHINILRFRRAEFRALGKSSDKFTVFVKRYLEIGQYVRLSPEYAAFIKICEILNHDFEDPIFIFICLSSGTGKSQLPFSITDFPMLYFCKDSTTRKQKIYEPFTKLSGLLNEYIEKDLEPYFQNHPRISLANDKHLDLDYSVLKDSRQQYWSVGLIVSLLQNMSTRTESSWIERQLHIEQVDVSPLTPSEAKEKLRELFTNRERFPIVFYDECTEMDYSLKFFRNMLRACGIMPVLMGTNAHAQNLCGHLSIGGSRSEDDPWCLIIVRLAPFSELCIKNSIRETYRMNMLITNFLKLLPLQRPWFSHTILNELEDPRTDLSMPAILDLFFKKFYRSKVNIASRGPVAMVINQFFFHGSSLLSNVKTAADLQNSFINNHIAHLHRPECICLSDGSTSLSALFRDPFVQSMAVPLYLFPYSEGKRANPTTDSSTEEERKVRVDGVLKTIDLHGVLQKFRISSFFEDLSALNDCLMNLSLLGRGIDKSFLLQDVEYKRFTSFKALEESKTYRIMPKYNNGTYLEVLTCASAAISSRTEGYKSLNFKTWLTNFLIELSYDFDYATQMNLVFNLKAGPTSFTKKLLTDLYVPFTYFPDAMPPQQLVELIKPEVLGEIHISQNCQSYDARMIMLLKNGENFNSCNVFFECKSIQKGAGLGKLEKKLSYFSKMKPLPPLVVFVVKKLSLRRNSLDKFDSTFFRLSRCEMGAYSFEEMKSGLLNQVVLFIDMSVLNAQNLLKLNALTN